MPQFRAAIIDATDPAAEAVTWCYSAATYHDGYNVALRRCPEGWQLVSVTTVPPAST